MEIQAFEDRQKLSRLEKAVVGFSLEVKATPSRRRIIHNESWAGDLESQGYNVVWNKNHTAFYAVIGDSHKPHEIDVAAILSENGISMSLDREGGVTVEIRRTKYTPPSLDGRIERSFTHEIYALNGRPEPRSVADGIAHSHKRFKQDERLSVQSDVAITYTPPGSLYTRKEIDEGVEEFRRRQANGETAASPRIYLHVDGGSRKVYYRRI